MYLLITVLLLCYLETLQSVNFTLYVMEKHVQLVEVEPC